MSVKKVRINEVLSDEKLICHSQICLTRSAWIEYLSIAFAAVLFMAPVFYYLFLR